MYSQRARTMLLRNNEEFQYPSQLRSSVVLFAKACKDHIFDQICCSAEFLGLFDTLAHSGCNVGEIPQRGLIEIIKRRTIVRYIDAVPEYVLSTWPLPARISYDLRHIPPFRRELFAGHYLLRGHHVCDNTSRKGRGCRPTSASEDTEEKVGHGNHSQNDVPVSTRYPRADPE